MKDNTLLYYIDGRLFEWTMTIGTILLGLQFIALPDSMKTTPFRWLAEIIEPDWLASIMLLAGFSRLGALAANGASLKIGPYLRSIGALVSAAVWFEFGYSFLLGSIKRGYGGPILFWFVFALAELYVVYRAVLDVRNYR
jgi:hypothetical protein